MDVDKGTGQVHVRRLVGVEDCRTVTNPMGVEGQIRGSLTEGFAIAFMQAVAYDQVGNCLPSSFAE